MHNVKSFKILYYLSFLVTLGLYILLSKIIYTYVMIELGGINFLLAIINLVLVSLFSFFQMKRTLENVNVLFPIIYLLFMGIVMIIAILYNNKLIIPYIHLSYYFTFILINYLLLNTYSLLAIKKESINN